MRAGRHFTALTYPKVMCIDSLLLPVCMCVCLYIYKYIYLYIFMNYMVHPEQLFHIYEYIYIDIYILNQLGLITVKMADKIVMVTIKILSLLSRI